MKKGKHLGEFNAKQVSMRVRQDGKLECNFEGIISGYGRGFWTMTITVGDGKSDGYEWAGIAYAENGDINQATGQGQWERIGANQWAINGTTRTRDGRTTLLSEGTMDLATRTWSGKYYEAIE
jgi:hypothetical protein